MRHPILSHVRQTAVFLVLAACATPSIAQELTGWPRCVAEQVVRLDDDHSNARTVAAAVLLRCRKVHIAELRAKLSAEDLDEPDVDKKLGELLDNKFEEGMAWVSSVVLRVRAKRGLADHD